MPRHWRSMLWLLAALSFSACAGGRQGGDAFETGAQPQDARVHVRNDAFWDANIYLLEGGTRRRLGTVNGHSTATFTLPRHLLFGLPEVRFLIDWIGRRDGGASDSIVVQPGDDIELTIRG